MGTFIVSSRINSGLGLFLVFYLIFSVGMKEWDSAGILFYATKMNSYVEIKISSELRKY